MLKLKNVSKFYYSKGVIASGFSRVNLELNMGEFVVITGESGSGKSTLLNVLSGLDTYEEGEMYINGQETSHYTEADFEEYRRKYVGNIFQNFNLINSYTVYQNVELALLLNGENKKDIEEKVNEIIDKVGLTAFKKTKCSKLSGGQKQRVAIARALAKETPIIVADEPTGNLDTESAAEVIKLLAEIAKDKLVIIVTHNIEQVEHHATRLIKMHDGKVFEDKVVKNTAIEDADVARDYRDITFLNRLRLGFRNAFNIPIKTLLIFAVFILIAFAVGSTYSSFQKMEYDNSLVGYNQFFNDTSDKRVVINKPDRSQITQEEFDKLEALPNVKKVVKDDVMIDYENSISDKEYNYYFYGNFSDIKNFDGEITYGRMPENPNEIVIEGREDDYYLSDRTEDVLGKTYYLDVYNANGDRIEDNPFTVVGIYINNDSIRWENIFYGGEEILSQVRSASASQYYDLKTLFEGSYYSSYPGEGSFYVVTSDKVPEGKAYADSELNGMVASGNCVGKEIEISTSSIYAKNSIKLKIAKTYNKANYKSLMGEAYKDDYKGRLFINPSDYDKLMNNGIFQSSVYVKDSKILDETLSEVQGLGFNTLAMRDALDKESAEMMHIVSMFKTFVIVSLIIALFFISYFILQIVLKSRNAYYTTIRTLGGSRKILKQMLDIELITIAVLAYGFFMGVMGLVYGGVITNESIVELADYLTPLNYAIMFVVIVMMAFLISTRFARRLFKNSVMSTFREEV